MSKTSSIEHSNSHGLQLCELKSHSRELESNCVPQMFLGRGGLLLALTIGQYFNLSLVTVPGVFAKVTRPSSLLVFKVVNGMVAPCNNMAAVTSYNRKSPAERASTHWASYLNGV